jgi:hypothetical protein
MCDDLQSPEDAFPKPIPSERETTILELQEKIDTLTTHQNEARRRAAYGGLKTDESKEYDARRKKISRLIELRLQHFSFKRQNSSRTRPVVNEKSIARIGRFFERK